MSKPFLLRSDPTHVVLLRFFAAVAVILIAALLQLFFASLGITANFVFACLITLAFLFGLRETVFFSLFAIIIFNWQPHISFEMILFFVAPIMAFISRRFSSWQPWAGSLIAMFFGILILYFALDPRMAVHHPATLILDIAMSMIFGSIVFNIFNRRENR